MSAMSPLDYCTYCIKVDFFIHLFSYNCEVLLNMATLGSYNQVVSISDRSKYRVVLIVELFCRRLMRKCVQIWATKLALLVK